MVAKVKSSFLKNSLQLFCHKNLFNGSGLATTTTTTNVPVSSTDRERERDKSSAFINHHHHHHHPLPRSSSSSKAPPPSSSLSKQNNAKTNYNNSSNLAAASAATTSLKQSKNHSNSSPNLNEIVAPNSAAAPINSNPTVITSSSNHHNPSSNDRFSSSNNNNMNITANHSTILENSNNSQAQHFISRRTNEIEIPIMRKPVSVVNSSSSHHAPSSSNSYVSRPSAAANNGEINLTVQSGSGGGSSGIRSSKSQNFYVHRNESSSENSNNNSSSFSASQPYFIHSSNSNSMINNNSSSNHVNGGIGGNFSKTTPILVDIQKTNNNLIDSPFRLNEPLNHQSTAYINKTNDSGYAANDGGSYTMNGERSRFNSRYNNIQVESDVNYASELDSLAVNHSKQLDELMNQKSASAMNYLKGQQQQFKQQRSRSSNGSMRVNNMQSELVHNNDTYEQQEFNDFTAISNKPGVGVGGKPKKSIDDLDYTQVETISVTEPPSAPQTIGEFDFKRRLNSSDNLDLEDCVEKMDRMETINNGHMDRVNRTGAAEVRMVSDFDSNIVLPFDIVSESKQEQRHHEQANNGLHHTSRTIPINVTNSSLYNNHTMGNLKLAKRIQLMSKQNPNNIVNQTSTTLKSNSSKIAGDTSSQGPATGDLVSILRDTSNGNSFRSNNVRQPISVNGSKYSILTSAGRKVMNRKENRDEIERRSYSSSNSLGQQARNQYAAESRDVQSTNGSSAKKAVRFADSLGLELENVITLSSHNNEYYDPQARRVIHYNYNTNNTPNNNNYYYSSSPNHITNTLYGNFNSYNASSAQDQAYLTNRQTSSTTSNGGQTYRGYGTTTSDGNYPGLNSSYGVRYEHDRVQNETGLRGASNSSKYLSNDLYLADSARTNGANSSNTIASNSAAKTQEQQDSYGSKASEFKYDADDYITKIAFGNGDGLNYVNKYLDEAENSLKIRESEYENKEKEAATTTTTSTSEKLTNNSFSKAATSTSAASSTEQLKTMPSGSYVLPIQTLMNPASVTAKALSNLEKIESKLNSVKHQFNSNSDTSLSTRSLSQQARTNEASDHSSSFSVLPSNNLSNGRMNTAAGRTSLSASGNNINVVTIGSQVLDQVVQEASSGAEQANEDEQTGGNKYTQIQVKGVNDGSSFDNTGQGYHQFDLKSDAKSSHEAAQSSSFMAQARSSASMSASASAAASSSMQMRNGTGTYKSNMSNGNYSGNMINTSNLGSSGGSSSSSTSSPSSSSASYPSPSNIKIHTRINNGKLESEV